MFTTKVRPCKTVFGNMSGKILIYKYVVHTL